MKEQIRHRCRSQADLDDPRLKEKFQQLFDKTMKAGVFALVSNEKKPWLLGLYRG